MIDILKIIRHDKPVYINNDLFGSTFRRDYRWSWQAVKTMSCDQSDERISRLLQNNPHIIQKERINLTVLTRRGVKWNISQLKIKDIIKIKRVGPNKSWYLKNINNINNNYVT
jgi:hypothetical protein